MMLLSTIPDLEILALDSCECFDSNKGASSGKALEERAERGGAENCCRLTMIFLTRFR
ncbi:hypothetical protein [Ruminococcus sp.]|uniref:hypothetical protein n=1 Tax=Ruminococcus sp. TaxID=41978 RepID=UPI0035207111